MTKTSRTELIHKLRTKELPVQKAIGILQTHHPETLQAIWHQYTWDKDKRYVLAFGNLGNKFNPKKVELNERQSMRKLGLLSEEEAKLLLELKHEELRIFLKEEKGEPLDEKDLSFREKYKRHDKRSDEKLTKDELATEQKWEAIRFAWVIECHTKHGDDFARMIYEGELQPPPDAMFDYKLPQKRPS